MNPSLSVSHTHTSPIISQKDTELPGPLLPFPNQNNHRVQVTTQEAEKALREKGERIWKEARGETTNWDHLNDHAPVAAFLCLLLIA